MTLPDPQKVTLVKQLLDAPSAPTIEDDPWDRDFTELYSKIALIRETLKRFAKGDFDSDITCRGAVAGSLKALQANLRHLTWQVEQVAGGDFSQRVDFMGDFSRAFNTMTTRMEQLIKDSKERERLLLLEILNSCPVCFSILVDGAVRFATPFMKDFLGVEVGDRLSDFFQSREIGERLIAEHRNERTFHWISIAMKAKGGDIKEMLANVYPTNYYDEQGIMVWLVDVTPIRDAEAELRRARDAAEALSRAKDAFVANMSHELRTPMNAVLGITHLLRQTKLSDQQEGYVKTMEKSVHILMRIVDDVLDFSRMTEGVLAMKSQAFSPAVALQEVLFAVSESVERKGLSLNCDAAADVPETVVGDPLRLKQVLLNLVDNAIKFTETGGIRLHVGIDRQNGNEVTLFFSVADTGIGVSEVDSLHLFNPFMQVDSSMSRNYGGTGLGLAICKNLVEMMQGTIWCESRESEGTTFFFTVKFTLPPMTDEHSEPSPPADDEETEDVGDDQRVDIPESLLGMRILLVEDNKINQLVATGLLNQKGFSVDVAMNGRQAVDMIRQKVYGIVLMDLQMPEMDGFEATRMLRQDPRFVDLPIVAMTANTMASDRERCLEAGMNDHVPKPIDPPTLYRSIVQWAKTATDLEQR